MNKAEVVKKLMEKTEYSEEKCVILNDILENHFIVGKNNKEKIVNDIIEKLDVTYEQADELYNVCMELVVKGVFGK